MPEKIKLKEYKLPSSSLIGGWFIPEKICNDLIKFYKRNKQLHFKGHTGKGVVESVKKSTDISLFSSDSVFFPYMKYLNKCLRLYEEKYPEVKDFQSYSTRKEPVNIQCYKPGEGFYTWHCERLGMNNASRTLVFMTYLNTVENAGTEFKYQKLKTEAIQGLTLIWPSDFTHTHRGIVSNTKEKFILTSWLNYD
jgi:prolyl 4-hydroxylase